MNELSTMCQDYLRELQESRGGFEAAFNLLHQLPSDSTASATCNDIFAKSASAAPSQNIVGKSDSTARSEKVIGLRGPPRVSVSNASRDRASTSGGKSPQHAPHRQGDNSSLDT